jgi:acetyl-CoA acetyltransferase
MSIESKNDQLTSLRGKAAMVGSALAGLGKAPAGRNFMELAGEVCVRAAQSAGVHIHEVDGIFGASMARMLWTVDLAEYLGIDPAYCDGTQLGGSSFESHCMSAALALDAGLCHVALICFSATTRSMRGPWPNLREPDLHQDPYHAEGLSTYAMVAARHMHEFGTSREQLAQVAVAARHWAQLNPLASKREPLSIEDVINSPSVSSPLTVRDCCLISDGAGAIIMMRADRAKHHCKTPAYLLGAGLGLSHTNGSQMPSLTTTAAVQSGRRAYTMAGLKARDIHQLQLYDAFTINVIMFLEDLGFCGKGEGGALVASGMIEPGGQLPVNTNGGGLSCAHPGMYGIFLLIEAFQQLSGEAGERQQSEVETVLCHGNGGQFSSQVTTIWGSEQTL